MDLPTPTGEFRIACFSCVTYNAPDCRSLDSQTHRYNDLIFSQGTYYFVEPFNGDLFP